MRRMLQGRAGMGLAFLLGLLIATAGTATAAKLITGKQIKDGSISSRDLSKAVRAQLAKAGVSGPKGDAGPPGAKGDPGVKGDPGPAAAPAAAEAWHEIGGLSEPAFVNGWTNVGNANEVTAGFYKDAVGVVHLKGIIDNGSSTIFTLPAGYRPGKFLAEIILRGAGGVQLVVASDGRVQVFSGSGAAFLDGVTFRAEN